jgi:hypothetical protein
MWVSVHEEFSDSFTVLDHNNKNNNNIKAIIGNIIGLLEDELITIQNYDINLINKQVKVIEFISNNIKSYVNINLNNQYDKNKVICNIWLHILNSNIYSNIYSNLYSNLY